MFKRRTVRLFTLIALAVSLGLPATASADGLIVVEPPICDVGSCPDPVVIADQLTIRKHKVDVSIEDQVATTKIDQVFHNPNDWVAEGTYLFPVPDGATVSNFAMWVDGDRVEAQIMDADAARHTYQEIVSRLRDPALLEYAGRGAIRARVFPIPPGKDRRIEISYQEVLTAEEGLIHYVYGLSTERFSAQPLEQVSVRVAINSDAPIRALDSPSHDLAVDRPDDHRVVAGYEASGVVPATDFELYYSVSEEAIGTNLVSTYDPVAGEGHFMLLAAPGIATPKQVIAKDVIVVLDTSGSMEGEKFQQARAALLYVLDHLNPEDRFGIVEFSTGARQYDSDLQHASEASNAAAWVARLSPRGGTDINLALLNAMAMVEEQRPTIVLFLTDGLPTEGETDVPGILTNVEDSAPANVRLFPFGVGFDVDTILLDSLAQAHHGRSTYVRPGEPLDEVVSGFYASVNAPVLADVALQVDGIQVEDVYPTPLPDLFAGQQLLLVGRYRQGGPATLTLRGTINGKERTFTYADQKFATGEGAEFLPRLWATRRIGYLLNQIRLEGEREEWVGAIVDLSVRYGIVTPYTSYLITEEDILTSKGRAEAAARETERMAAAPSSSSGQEAVDEAKASGDMAAASAAPVATPVGGGEGAATEGAIRVVGSRAFILQDGVWTDTGFDPSAMTTIQVAFTSDAYFRLLETNPDLGPAFALGQRVIALSGGQAYEVVPNSADVPANAPPAARSAADTRAVVPGVTFVGLLTRSNVGPSRP